MRYHILFFMRGNSPSRVQVVVSGKFLGLLMIAASLLGGGYYWHTQQLEVQRRFRTPPYFIKRSPAVIRLCNHCMDLDKLKPRADWNIGAPSTRLNSSHLVISYAVFCLKKKNNR